MGIGTTHDYELEQAALRKLEALRSEAASVHASARPFEGVRCRAGRALRVLGEAALELARRLEVGGLEEQASGA